MQVNLYWTDTKEIDPTGQVVLWSNYSEDSRIPSIPQLIDDRLNGYREEYIDFIESLRCFSYKRKTLEEHLQCDNISFWWASLLQEKSVYKTPCMYTSVKFMALRDWCQENEVTALKLVGSHVSDQKLFSSFCQDNKIKLIKNGCVRKKISLPLKIRLMQSKSHLFSTILWLVNFLLKKRKAFQSVPKESEELNTTVVTYVPNFDRERAKQGQFFSYYWSSLLEKPVNHLLMYAQSKDFNFIDALSLRKKLNESGKKDRFFLLEDFLDWGVIVEAVKIYCKMAIRSRLLSSALSAFKREKKIAIPLDFLLKEGWLSSIRGICCMDSAISSRLFQRYLSHVSQQSLGLYLMENHGWERLLIQAWRKSNNGSIVGYAHSSVREGDWRYFNPISCAAEKSHMPDFITTNTSQEKQFFLQQGFKEKQVVVVEATRYLYLSSLRGDVIDATIQESVEAKIPKTILVLTDISTVDADRLLAVSSQALAGMDHQVIIKPHPFLPNPENLVEKYFSHMDYELSSEHLAQLLPDVDFVILSAATSAVLEVMAIGIPYAALAGPNSFNLSPPQVAKEKIVSSVKALRDKLQQTDFSSKPSCQFYLDPHFTRWNHLLEKQYAH